MRTFCILAMAAICAMCAVPVLAADIVTVPTANQLGPKEFDLAAYYISLDQTALGLPPNGPDYVTVQTLYLGVTKELELDVHAYQIHRAKEIGATKNSYEVLIATYRICPETAKNPIIVLGGRNLTQANDGMGHDDVSWYMSAAKTINQKPGGPPKWPIIRLHLSAGTPDNTILGFDRHDGIFGGVQLRLSPQIGAIVLNDSRDTITGLTFDPVKELTIKGGTYGTHWWVGMSLAKSWK